jgi:hypothetical protein
MISGYLNRPSTLVLRIKISPLPLIDRKNNALALLSNRLGRLIKL